MIGKWEKVIMTVLVIAAFAAGFFCTGCQSAPDRKDYATDACFVAADCKYRNRSIFVKQDNADCVQAYQGCRDSLKEKSYLDRVIFCKDETKRGNMTEAECRTYLNQK